MSGAADLLWRVNNEYTKRLTHVNNTLNLLVQLMLVQPEEPHERVQAALHHALEQVQTMLEEHRVWRYAYFYESLETRRMVQSVNAINRALARFTRMRNQHERRLNDLRSLLGHLPRPDPDLTRVPNGDLWQMTEFALNDLNHFDDYMRELSSA